MLLHGMAHRTAWPPMFATVALALSTLQAIAASSEYVISIQGTSHFDSVIAHNRFTFVKFFDPACPHCKALAPHFQTIAKNLHELNSRSKIAPEHRVIAAEVDNSRKENGHVMNKHAEGYPTLKLFFAGILVSEYEGPRRPAPMLEYIQSAVNFRSADLIQPLTSREHIDAFLNTSATRPVVISVFHDGYDAKMLYPSHVRACPMKWHTAARQMRNGSAPDVAFASVNDPALLIPSNGPVLERFKRMRRVPFLPAIAAASSGEGFWKRASWWFPGVHADDSMATFMHVSTIPENGYTVVDRLNVRHLLSSVRPLVLVFGEEEKPAWEDRAFLFEAARFSVQPRLVPLYIRTENFKEFAEHAGVLGPDALNETEGDSAYLLYRQTSYAPEIYRFSRESGKSSSLWLGDRAREVNRSNIAMTPGKVLDLNRNMWNHVFTFDGRGVLLELYRSDCGACRRFASIYERAARILLPRSGAIVVARFDLAKGFLPPEPKLPQYKYVPSVFFIPAGGDAVLFEGWATPRSIAKFAGEEAEVEDIPLGNLEGKDMVGSFLFILGLLIVGSGFLVSKRGERKREHVT